MKKITIKKFGRKCWLLGRRKEDGQKIWLEDFSWDCGWYWAGGYLEVFTKNGRDIREHFHFDNTFLKGAKATETIKNYFKETTLTEEEWWRLLDLFKQFYTIKECAEVFQYGGHYTSKGRTKQEINKRLAKALNKHLEKVIIPEIRKLLS